jgi:hypothetical protein
MRMNRLFLPVLAALLAVACADDRKAENLPPATGVSGDIYLVMDSLQWEGPLGFLMDSLLNAEMRGLPREEGIFRSRWIDPRKLNFVLKQRRNLIFLTTLDAQGQGAAAIRKMFGPESIERIKKDTTLFVTTESNLFANGQEVMFLFSQTEEELIRKITQNATRVVEHFNVTELKRLSASLMKSGRQKGVSDWLQQHYGVELQVPFGYKLVENNPEFLWVRQINPKDDRNIFIARTPYVSTAQFDFANMIRFRNEVCRKYLFEDPDIPDSYLVTETEVPFIPVEARKVRLGGVFATELRGLWRTYNKSMGGPFVGFALVDERAQQFYYIEGFTFAPGREQREIIRELEAILFTFKLRGEPAVDKAASDKS